MNIGSSTFPRPFCLAHSASHQIQRKPHRARHGLQKAFPSILPSWAACESATRTFRVAEEHEPAIRDCGPTDDARRREIDGARPQTGIGALSEGRRIGCRSRTAVDLVLPGERRLCLPEYTVSMGFFRNFGRGSRGIGTRRAGLARSQPQRPESPSRAAGQRTTWGTGPSP